MLDKLTAGTLTGLVGTWVLDRVDWFNWNRERAETRARTRAARPGGRDPAHELVQRVAQRFDLDVGDPRDNAAGHAAHYAIGVSGALTFALLRERMAPLGPFRGLAFGLGLFLLQDEGANTLLGLSGRPGDHPWQDHARGLAAHLAFGVAVDGLLGVLDRR